MPARAVESHPTSIETIQTLLPNFFDKSHTLQKIEVLMKSDSPRRVLVFNQAMEQIETKPYDEMEWKTYQLED